MSTSEMTRSTQVLSTKQESDSPGIRTVKAAFMPEISSNNIPVQSEESPDEPGYGMAHSWTPQSALFSAHSISNQADDYVPASACSLKSFRRLESPPVAAGPSVTQTSDSSHSFQYTGHRESNGPECVRNSSPAPPIPPQPLAPKKPPRKTKSKSSQSHNPYSASASPDQMTGSDQESAAILTQNHVANEEQGDGLENIIHTLNQSIDLLDKSENGNDVSHQNHQIPAKPMRKSHSRENLADGETGDHPGHEDSVSDVSLEAKAKPPKPAPPPKPKPKIAVPSSTSSYL